MNYADFRMGDIIVNANGRWTSLVVERYSTVISYFTVHSDGSFKSPVKGNLNGPNLPIPIEWLVYREGELINGNEKIPKPVV